MFSMPLSVALMCIRCQLTHIPVSGQNCDLAYRLHWIGWKLHLRSGFIEFPPSKISKFLGYLRSMGRISRTSWWNLTKRMGLAIWFPHLWPCMRIWLWHWYYDLYYVPTSFNSLFTGFQACLIRSPWCPRSTGQVWLMLMLVWSVIHAKLGDMWNLMQAEFYGSEIYSHSDYARLDIDSDSELQRSISSFEVRAQIALLYVAARFFHLIAWLFAWNVWVITLVPKLEATALEHYLAFGSFLGTHMSSFSYAWNGDWCESYPWRSKHPGQWSQQVGSNRYPTTWCTTGWPHSNISLWIMEHP